MSVAGNLFMIGSVLLAGPAAFVIPLPPSIGRIFASTVLAGMGFATLCVSSFTRTYAATANLKFRDGLNTYVMLTGDYFFFCFEMV